jgi:hypothetical protein
VLLDAHYQFVTAPVADPGHLTRVVHRVGEIPHLHHVHPNAGQVWDAESDNFSCRKKFLGDGFLVEL